MTIKKGDIVTVGAQVYTARREKPLESRKETLLHRPDIGPVRTCLFRSPTTPWRGLVIGRTHLQTGDYHWGEYDACLCCDKAHIVFKVVPMDTERYRHPVTVLEGDMVLLIRQGASLEAGSAMPLGFPILEKSLCGISSIDETLDYDE